MTSTPHPIENGEFLSLSQIARTCEKALQRLLLSGIYPFAGTLLPDGRLAPNFMYLGQIGSGKTLELRMLMRHVLGAMAWDGSIRPRYRMVVFDVKGEDLMPSLRQWCPPEYLLDVHAYSEECVVLHLGKSCTTPEDAEELAYAIVPEIKGGHPFFDEAARQILLIVILALQRRSNEWGLSDLIIACTDERLLRHVASFHPGGKDVLARYLKKRVEASDNMLQTMATKLDPWRNISLLEKKASHYITVDGWLESGGVIVLRGSARNPRTIESWNSFLFKLLVARLRDRAENYPVDETFLFVDEMPESILDSYRDALLLGRIKGVRTAATIQDPGGLIARFGSREKASEALGQIGNLAVGRLASPDAAEWMSAFFGKFEYWQEKRSLTTSQGQRSMTVSHDLREEHNVYPYEFQNFPKATLRSGYEIVARVPDIGAWRKHVDARFLQQMLAEKPPSETERRRRHLASEDIAFTWASDDYARLRIPPPPPPKRRRGSQGGFRLP